MTVALRVVGPLSYARAHALQERWVAARADGQADDALLVLEHPPTITIGRHRGAADSVLAPEGVDIVAVERGGDATWHAPGQLVVYPIVALPEGRRDLRAHLHHLEGAVIATLRGLGLPADRDPRNTGVWLPAVEGPPRKVCSIGVACRRWVTWHGLALNVDLPLEGFARIRPCGFSADVMTRLADHVSPCPGLDALEGPIVGHLVEALGLAPARRRVVAAEDVSLDGLPGAHATALAGPGDRD